MLRRWEGLPRTGIQFETIETRRVHTEGEGIPMGTAAVTTRISVEEYLRTPFRPDVDYVDGVIEERNLGEWDHAGLQSILDRMFGAKEEEWGIFSSTELRVRVSPTRVRIPDVCVTDARNATERVPTKAPLLCVEVKSPEDRLPRMFERVKDFHRMGVEQVWVFDPETQKVWISVADGVQEWSGGVLSVPRTKIELDPAIAFDRLAKRR
jgi:Uma2 family endonuclease